MKSRRITNVSMRLLVDHGSPCETSLRLPHMVEATSLVHGGVTMPRQLINFTVHVYRPNGHLLIKFSESCTRADVAVNRAKKRIYRMGRLAHFYTYVPKTT